jgi:hypothetical protein
LLKPQDFVTKRQNFFILRIFDEEFIQQIQRPVEFALDDVVSGKPERIIPNMGTALGGQKEIAPSGQQKQQKPCRNAGNQFLIRAHILSPYSNSNSPS